MAIGLLIFLIVFIFSYFNLGGEYQTIQNARISIFSRLSVIGSFISELKRIGDLTGENTALREENTKLLAELAANSEIKDENIFLKEILELNSPVKYRATEARTFNVNLTPEGHSLLINVGSIDGIEKDDIVISSSGVLIGQVADANEHSSRIKLVTDSDFKATIKLMNKEITGISVGLLGDGISLDFISQNDETLVGDTVVTSGNDLFPPGLIIGTINEVGFNDGGLFKKITVKPAFISINIGRVLVLNKPRP